MCAPCLRKARARAKALKKAQLLEAKSLIKKTNTGKPKEVVFMGKTYTMDE